MKRRRLTELFPGLKPIRKIQRKLFFYARMCLDGSRYARGRSGDALAHSAFLTSLPLYNKETGFDMIYQENKVFNLKLAAATLDGVIIRPGETFSFWKLVRRADRRERYKDGLVVIDGRLTTAPGGGMCQMSNLLFWMFLHTPLTIVERHGHRVKDFPDPASGAPSGVDAAISEGWLDLKVKNDTQQPFQIHIAFDEERIIGQILTERDQGYAYEIVNENPLYYRSGKRVFEEVDVRQNALLKRTGEMVSSRRLYRNRCEIGYPLPVETPIADPIVAR